MLYFNHVCTDFDYSRFDRPTVTRGLTNDLSDAIDRVIESFSRIPPRARARGRVSERSRHSPYAIKALFADRGCDDICELSSCVCYMRTHLLTYETAKISPLAMPCAIIRSRPAEKACPCDSLFSLEAIVDVSVARVTDRNSLEGCWLSTWCSFRILHCLFSWLYTIAIQYRNINVNVGNNSCYIESEKLL